MAGNGRFTREDDAELTRKGAVAEAPDDDRLALDLDAEEEPQFLRGQRRVPVRRGPLPKKTAIRLKYVALTALAAGVLFTVAFAVYRYGAHSWRFRVESGESIELNGNQNVTRAQVMEVMGADIGRNVFFIPLDDRKKQLEEIPWVESAAVMRLLPDRLRIQVKERTPVAFVQLGSKILLVDAGGVLMELPPKSKDKYSFPVIVGASDPEPLSTRAARMKIYNGLVRNLDSDGSNYSKDLSEVDLADPDDVKVTVADPAGAVLLHLGSSNFLERYKTYISHAAEWRAQYQKLESVDLRFDRQVIVNPDPRSSSSAPPATSSPTVQPTKTTTKPKPQAKAKTNGKRAAKPTHRN
jgi:cell division protein FtsQ